MSGRAGRNLKRPLEGYGTAGAGIGVGGVPLSSELLGIVAVALVGATALAVFH